MPVHPVSRYIDLAISPPLNYLIDMDHLQKVEANGQPAGLTGGRWNYDLGGWDIHRTAKALLQNP